MENYMKGSSNKLKWTPDKEVENNEEKKDIDN